MSEALPVALDTSATSRHAAMALLRAVVRHRLASVGLVIIAALCFLAIFAPLLAPYSPYDQDLYSVLAPPSAAHWLGTDNLGRDLLSRLMFGAQISLTVAVFAVLMEIIIGTVLGAVAGYYATRAIIRAL